MPDKRSMEPEKQTILIVDDEYSIRLTLGEALATSGYAVETASSGEEALQKLSEEPQPFALILLDLRLPGLDGMEVLRVLQRDRPEIPVIVITAHGNVETALEAMDIGAHSFITKPFTPDLLREVVAYALDRDRQATEAAASYEQHLQEAAASLEARHLNAALVHARKALSLDATRPEAFNLMGVLMQLMGELQAARRYFASALALQSGYVPAQQNQENLSRPPSERNLGEYHLE